MKKVLLSLSLSLSAFLTQGELRICVLPSHLSYDAPWPVRKVPTKATPHYVSFHLESKTHPVILSEQVPLKEVPVGDETTQHEPVERGQSVATLLETSNVLINGSYVFCR